jgi:hypothetical protein
MDLENKSKHFGIGFKGQDGVIAKGVCAQPGKPGRQDFLRQSIKYHGFSKSVALLF